MIWLIVSAVLLLALVALPFVVAQATVKQGQKQPLQIKSDNLRDPRYFAKSFRAMMRRALDAAAAQGENTVRLSREESLVTPAQLDGAVCTQLLWSKEDYAPKRAMTFKKEMYLEGDAYLPGGTQLRAVLCEGNLTMDEGCTVVRWADAEKLFVARGGCALGISASSARKLVVGVGCTFRRLYAPEVLIGAGTVAAPRAIPERREQTIERNPNDIEPGATLERTIITHYDFTIHEGACIFGSVKTTRSLLIEKDACITGNVIADGVLVVEAGVRIGGIVFSQNEIYLGPNVQIGAQGVIKSVIAKNFIALGEGLLLHGYASCERSCETLDAQAFAARTQKAAATILKSSQKQIALRMDDELDDDDEFV